MLSGPLKKRVHINLFYGYSRESDGAVGCVFRPTCNFWFDTKPYNSSVIISPSPPTQAGKNNTMIIVIVKVTICVIIIIASICIFSRLRRKKKHNEADIQELNTRGLIRYDFNLLKLATSEFSIDAQIGRGGFGTVYRGNLEGKDVAIKRLQRSSGGEKNFKTEVLILGNLMHRNLVRLLGYCISRDERLLVYEYLSNGSLNRYISDPSKRIQLNWEKRYKIITGIVNGLVYLHRDCYPHIVHRDLKFENILLGENLDAKIADFGLATLFTNGEFQHHTSQAVGTYGYMPPEYVFEGHYSEKTDIYSFGVMMLELIGGQRRSSHCNLHGETIVSGTWRHWKNNTLYNAIDPSMKMEQDAHYQVNRCINIGLLCVQKNVGARPTSEEVAHMLDISDNQDILIPLPSSPRAYEASPLLNDSFASCSTRFYYTLQN